MTEAQRGVRSLLLTRAVVTTLLVGLVALVALGPSLPFPLAPFIVLAGVSYLVSLGAWGLVSRVAQPSRLAEAVIYTDVVLETALVYVTGGVYSAFPFIYLLSVLAASIVVAPRCSFAIATAGVLLHGLVLVLQFLRWLPPTSHLAGPRDLVVEGSLAILLVSGNVCASFIVAYVARRLAERLREARGEARRTQASLAELLTLHEDIVQSVASGLLAFDRDGRVTTVNRSAETLCRRREAELRGMAWDALFEQGPSFAVTCETLARGDRAPVRFEARLIRADGSRIPVGVSPSFLRREMGVICSFQDLTEIRRMEDRVRQADRLAAIGRFAAGLAHEVRNPMGSIRGSVEVLRQSLELEGDDRRLMDIVLRESDRLNGIITDFLEFSRPHATTRLPTDLVALVDEVLVLVANRGRGPLRIVREFGEPTVKADMDGGQVRQALWNLIGNALEAMPSGGELRVGIRAIPGDPGPGTVQITVQDSGVGVSAQHLPHLFEPFFTTKAGGTGLGLSIVHRIVEDHGGEIRVESEAGVGTRVVLTLPREAP